MITEVFKPKSKIESEHIADYHWVHNIKPFLEDKDNYFYNTRNRHDSDYKEIKEIIQSKFNSFNYFIDSRRLNSEILGILEYLTENIKTKDFEVINFPGGDDCRRSFNFLYNPKRFCHICIREEKTLYNRPRYMDNIIMYKSWGYLF